jgi:hypothetical protein
MWAGLPLRLERGRPETWAGPFRPEAQTEQGGFHGAWENNAGGYIWKDRKSGAEDVLLDLLPRRLLPIAEQLLGVGAVTQRRCSRRLARTAPRSSRPTAMSPSSPRCSRRRPRATSGSGRSSRATCTASASAAPRAARTTLGRRATGTRRASARAGRGPIARRTPARTLTVRSCPP